MRPFQLDGSFQRIDLGDGFRRTAVRSAGAAITGSASGFAVQIGSVMILARLLTPADFGIVTMVTTFSLLVRSFGLNGFTELIMQRELLTVSLASNLFWINMAIGTALTLAFAASAPLLALFYHNAAVTEVAVGMSLTIVIGSLGHIHLAILQRAMHFRSFAIISFVGHLSLVVTSIILAVAGFHYWALVAGIIAQAVVTSACAWFVCQWIPSMPRRVAGTGSGVKFAMNVYSHFAFAYVTRNTDNLLVGWRFSAQTLGFYKKAYDLFVLPEQQLFAPIGNVAVSALSRVSGNREQYERYFLRAISVLALIGLGIGTDFALVGAHVIRFLLGPGWDEAGRIFALFGPGIGIHGLYSTQGWIHLSIGRPDRWFRWGLIEFVFTVTLFLLTLRWGPSGIALAWTTSYFIMLFPGFWYAGKPIGLGIGSVLATVWRYFVAALGAGVATALMVGTIPHLATGGGAQDALIAMCLVSLLFVGLYIGAVIALHQGLEPLVETAGLFRELMPKRRAKVSEQVEIHE